LEKTYSNKKKRSKIIVEECIFYIDISIKNVLITTKLLKEHISKICTIDHIRFRSNTGDMLKTDILAEFGVDKFNAVIGNPPYNSSIGTGTGHTIWQFFTKQALTKCIKDNGYLLFVHPPGWRKPNTKRCKYYGLYDLMTNENQMLYLEIHGLKDGAKTFNCGTRYDWYLIQRKNQWKNTIVVDEFSIENNLDLTTFSWLPNFNIQEIQNMLASEHEESCPIIYNSFYNSISKQVNTEKSREFKYPIIHTITKRIGVRYLYTNNNTKGHFGISKVILCDSGLNDAVIDMDGEYGMSGHSMGIQVSSVKEANKVRSALLSDSFKHAVKAMSFSNYQLDWRIFTYLRKDFWKDFTS